MKERFNPNQYAEEDRLLTVREVARILRCDDTTVRRWIKSGSLEAITLPHRGRRQAYRIKQSILDALLKPKAESLEQVSPLALPRYERRDGTRW